MPTLRTQILSSRKKRCAVFTIVKNEPYFLTKYLAHYGQYFDPADIFILDHESDDGSTNSVPATVVRICNELAFDHKWLRQTVMDFQQELLNKYECAIFAEVDEILYSPSKPLDRLIEEFLQDSHSTYITCRGYEVVQHDDEPPLTEEDYIFSKRHHWFANPVSFNKSLISKTPMNWCNGFHKAFLPQATDLTRSNVSQMLPEIFTNKTTGEPYDLFMCHLHKFDLGLMIKRHKARLSSKQMQDGGAPHNRSVDPGFLARYIATYKQVGSTIETIPALHLASLRHL